MLIPERILVIHDSPDFGGHEIMFGMILPYLLASDAIERITIVYFEGNVRLDRMLHKTDSTKLELVPWKYRRLRRDTYLGAWRWRYGQAVKQLVASARPHKVLLLQGGIESCAVPMLAMPKTQPLVSYLAMVGSVRGSRLVDRLRDRVRARLYRRPMAFMVPSETVAQQLDRINARTDAAVIGNLPFASQQMDRATARAALGIDPRRRVALFMGRMDVRQKGLNTLRDALLASAGELSDWTFLFVGDGEGDALVRQLRDGTKGVLDIRLFGWVDDAHLYLAAADVMLLPSRWEGLPLVVLEAMSHGLPVLASKLEVFKDHIPQQWQIDFTCDLARALNQPLDRASLDEYRRLSEGVHMTDVTRPARIFLDVLCR